MWGESGESLAPLSSPSSPPSPSSEGRSSLSLSQQITFLTEQYWDGSLNQEKAGENVNLQFLVFLVQTFLYHSCQGCIWLIDNRNPDKLASSILKTLN